jgi:hypothetical protein
VSLTLATTVLDDIKTAVDPVEADLYRPETVAVPFVWVRPATTSIGPKSAQSPYRRGLLTVDIWAWSWADVDGLEAEVIGAVTGERSGPVRYHLESETRVSEPDACHSTLIFSTYFDDLRGAA